jgi:acetyltransferase-like isoleucine patch superfamily enzyme/acyl carrier protein
VTAPASGQPLLAHVVGAVARIRPGRAPQPEDAFTALGLDSLDRLTLAVAIEQSAGLAVSDQVLSAAVSPADLTRRLLAHTDRSVPVNQPDPAVHLPAAASGWLDEGAAAGDGTRLWHGAQIAAGARVGAGCTLGKNSFIGAGSIVGDRVKIGNNASVFGAVIADEAMICPGALLLEDPAPRATTPSGQRKGPADWTRHPVTVHPGATVGAGAVIAPGITVGTRAMVALGAVVLRDVPAHALVIGNPARQAGWVCHCGHTLDSALTCPACQRTYISGQDEVSLLPSGPSS